MTDRGLVDIERHAAAQLSRMAHWLGFPETKEARRDYVAAFCALGDYRAVTDFVDALVIEPFDRMPSLAFLRERIYDRNLGAKAKRKSCQICHGVGAITVWRLVTYHRKSLQVKKYENLPDLESQEEANAYITRLIAWQEANPVSDEQIVVSAAKDCSCHPTKVPELRVGRDAE